MNERQVNVVLEEKDEERHYEKATHRIGTRRPVQFLSDKFDTLTLSFPFVNFGPHSMDSLVSGSTKVKMMEAMGATATRPHTSASFT